jgi:pimeloyl-ACP methyl ester carboxylesterase
MGALIALELGSRFPDRVNRITLINLPYFDRKEDRARAFQMMGHVCYHSKLLCKLTTLPFRFNSWMWVRPYLRYGTLNIRHRLSLWSLPSQPGLSEIV